MPTDIKTPLELSDAKSELTPEQIVAAYERLTPLRKAVVRQHIQAVGVRVGGVLSQEEKPSSQSSEEDDLLDIESFEIPKDSLVLIIDDQPVPRELMRRAISPHCDVVTVNNIIDGLNFINQNRATGKKLPDLVLSDVNLPGIEGTQLCSLLHADPELKSLPVILVTGTETAARTESTALRDGAEDCIQKGIPNFNLVLWEKVAKQLRHRMIKQRFESRLRKKTKHLQGKTEELEATLKELREKEARILRFNELIAEQMGNIAEYRDTDTGAHIRRMSYFTEALARACGFDPDWCRFIRVASSLHDIGKVGIPDAILLKPGKLTDEEMGVMKTHASIGRKMLSRPDLTGRLFYLARHISWYHHEKWDGTGYPDGLVGDEIPIEARIAAIADVFDALTMKRPYKDGWTIDQAMAHIQSESGKHFDPQLVGHFIRILPEILEIKERINSEEKKRLEEVQRQEKVLAVGEKTL